jgi:hypothetical protein
MKVNQKSSPTLRDLSSKIQGETWVGDGLLIARFREGESTLSAEQEQRLASWIVGSPLVNGKVDLILGGARNSSRSGRLRRLHGLLLALGRLGVAARRIWPDIEWTKPARMGAIEDMPEDTVWLRLADHHKAYQ